MSFLFPAAVLRPCTTCISALLGCPSAFAKSLLTPDLPCWSPAHIRPPSMSSPSLPLYADCRSDPTWSPCWSSHLQPEVSGKLYPFWEQRGSFVHPDSQKEGSRGPRILSAPHHTSPGLLSKNYEEPPLRNFLNGLDETESTHKLTHCKGLSIRFNSLNQSTMSNHRQQSTARIFACYDRSNKSLC